MLKLSSGISTLYYAIGREKSFNIMAEIGYDGVDYGIPHSKLQPSHELFSADTKTFEKYFTEDKTFAQKAGLEILQTHATFPVYTEGHPEKFDENIEAVKKSIIATRIVGCNTVVIHGAMPSWKTEHDHDEYCATNRYMLEKILPVAEEYNVTVALENMPAVPFKPDELAPVTSRPETIIEYIDMMNSPNLGACLDTGHANCANIPAGKFARLLGKRLKALHLHDNFSKSDSHSLLYTGTTDWKDFADALKEIGYSGSLSLEWRLGNFPKDYMIKAEEFAFQTLKKFATDNGL